MDQIETALADHDARQNLTDDDRQTSAAQSAEIIGTIAATRVMIRSGAKGELVCTWFSRPTAGAALFSCSAYAPGRLGRLGRLTRPKYTNQLALLISGGPPGS